VDCNETRAAELTEAGTLLMVPGRVRDQGDWAKDVALMANAANSAYKSQRLDGCR
jgi:hypothetical protein